MKIHFLGTGAADWKPDQADTSGSFRRFSSILVDDTLLVDPGPCIPEFVRSYNLPALIPGITDIINTHPHSDHLCQSTVDLIGRPLHSCNAWETLETDNHIITAYPAHHGTVKSAVHFVIENKTDGKRFFYGCDGAWLYYDTAKALSEQYFDLMIFDCTIGEIAGDYRIFEHNNIAMVAEMKAFFEKKNCSRFMVSHLARTLHPDRQETEEIFRRYGIETAYDNRIVFL